jgi:hypothetical protein
MKENFNKKFPGQNFGQNTVATENVAAETVTTGVAEVANNKTSIFTAKNAKIAGGVTLALLAIVGGVIVYKKASGRKKATEEMTTTADPDFEEAK